MLHIRKLDSQTQENIYDNVQLKPVNAPLIKEEEVTKEAEEDEDLDDLGFELD